MMTMEVCLDLKETGSSMFHLAFNASLRAEGVSLCFWFSYKHIFYLIICRAIFVICDESLSEVPSKNVDAEEFYFLD